MIERIRNVTKRALKEMIAENVKSLQQLAKKKKDRLCDSKQAVKLERCIEHYVELYVYIRLQEKHEKRGNK